MEHLYIVMCSVTKKYYFHTRSRNHPDARPELSCSTRILTNSPIKSPLTRNSSV